MGIAICIKCGHIKKKPFESCVVCGFNPEGDYRAKAQSALLSDSHYNEETESFKSKEELLEISKLISRGGKYSWNEDLLTELISQQRELDEGAYSEWYYLAMLFLYLAAILIAIVAVVFYFF